MTELTGNDRKLADLAIDLGIAILERVTDYSQENAGFRDLLLFWYRAPSGEEKEAALTNIIEVLAESSGHSPRELVGYLVAKLGGHVRIPMLELLTPRAITTDTDALSGEFLITARAKKKREDADV